MKIAHLNNWKKNPNAQMHISGWMKKADEIERTGETYQAISEYLDIVAKYPLHEKAYNRLMILYRKTKQRQREKEIIETAIHHFRNQYGPASTGIDKKIARLSKSLSSSLGLTDRHGSLLYDPGPVGRWEKRKKSLEKMKTH